MLPSLRLEIEKRLGQYDSPDNVTMGEYEIILRAIAEITQEREGPCTTREIMALTGMTRNVVHTRLREMVKLGGMVRFERAKSRTILLAGQVGDRAYYRVPSPEEVVAILRPTQRQL